MKPSSEKEDRLSQSILLDRLDYDQTTGVMTWKKGRTRGSPAGFISKTEYVVIRVFSRNYLAHRLVWLHQTGNWPTSSIDHINGIKWDNGICNLREASPTQNSYNSKLDKRNKSGQRGVFWYKRLNKWRVGIQIEKKKKFYGFFDDLSEAIAVAKTVHKEKHGEFYNEQR